MKLNRKSAIAILALTLSGLGVGAVVASSRVSADVRPLGKNSELRPVAAARGYAEKKDPLGAYIADCLTGKGFKASYDDATGYVKYDGDPDIMIACMQALRDAP